MLAKAIIPKTVRTPWKACLPLLLAPPVTKVLLLGGGGGVVWSPWQDLMLTMSS